MRPADAGAAAAKVQHRRGGNRYLGRMASADLALEVLVVGELYVLHMADLVDHPHCRRGEFLGAVGLDESDGYVGLHASELVEEINMEIGASEFAVGDAFEPHVLLEADDFGDGAVLHQPQLLLGEFAARLAVARLQQVLRPQKTAHVVVAGGQGGVDHAGLLIVLDNGIVSVQGSIGYKILICARISMKIRLLSNYMYTSSIHEIRKVAFSAQCLVRGRSTDGLRVKIRRVR